MPKVFDYEVLKPFPHKTFGCQLYKLQCEHISNKSGHRCRRFQIIGAGFCWQHLETDRHLKIKKSTLPHGGLGLFAYNGTNNDAIVFSAPKKTKYGQRPGDFIIEYTGETLPRQEIDRRYGNYTAPYGADINKQFVTDAACLRSSGSIANHMSHSKANARLISNRTSIRLEATKNIRNGSEIFIDYGSEYQLGDEGVEYRHQTVNYFPRR